MNEKKKESYLDDLLKEVEQTPVNYDGYIKKSGSNGASTDLTEVDFSENNPEGLADLNWDDVSIDDIDFGKDDFPDFGEEAVKAEKEGRPEAAEESEMEEAFKTAEKAQVLQEPAESEIMPAADNLPAAEESEITQQEERKVTPTEEELDNLVENLLDNLDNAGSLEEEELETEVEAGPESPEEEMEEEGMESESVDDLLSLLSDTDFEEGQEESDDTKEVPEALGEPQAAGEEDDIFSLDDMLSDLGDLDDFEEEGDAQQEAIADLSLDGLSLEEPAVSEETESLDDALADLGEASGEEAKKKNSIFQKIFGNVHDEKARKKEEAALRAKEEKEKKKKPKKTKEELAEEKKLKDQEKKEKQEEAKKIKEAKKKEKEEKKKKKKEAKMQEEEVDEGRINRVGAVIVFSFFAVVAAGVIFGSQGFSYSRSISKATEFFGIRQYTEAYDEVRGVQVKEDDQEIYDKIMTVMYVNKQLNSYNNYYSMRMYPEALDSLLKGLKRYDEYISFARELGIEGDMDYVKNQLVGELEQMYQMSEADAYQIIAEQNQEAYSRKVIENASIE